MIDRQRIAHIARCVGVRACARGGPHTARVDFAQQTARHVQQAKHVRVWRRRRV